jgi:hypothetical protein
MLLKAAEMHLNGICIGAFHVEHIKEALHLSLSPLLIMAIGKGTDDIRLTEISETDNHAYYRTEGVHYVPKVRIEDLILS